LKLETGEGANGQRQLIPLLVGLQEALDVGCSMLNVQRSFVQRSAFWRGNRAAFDKYGAFGYT
jgi:hypothetical protein